MTVSARPLLLLASAALVLVTVMLTVAHVMKLGAPGKAHHETLYEAAYSYVNAHLDTMQSRMAVYVLYVGDLSLTSRDYLDHVIRVASEARKLNGTHWVVVFLMWWLPNASKHWDNVLALKLHACVHELMVRGDVALAAHLMKNASSSTNVEDLLRGANLCKNVTVENSTIERLRAVGKIVERLIDLGLVTADVAYRRPIVLACDNAIRACYTVETSLELFVNNVASERPFYT